MDYDDFLQMRGLQQRRSRRSGGNYSELPDDVGEKRRMSLLGRKSSFTSSSTSKRNDGSSFTRKAPNRSSSFDLNLLRPSKRNSLLAKKRDSESRRSSVKSSLLKMLGGEDAVGLLDLLEGSGEFSEEF